MYHGLKEAFHTIGMILSYTSDILVIYITMRFFKTLGNFSLYEVVFLFSIELLTYSLANSFFWFVDETYNLFVRAKFDEVLVKPLPPLFYLSARYFEVGYVGQFIVSIFLLFLSLSKLELSWSIMQWSLYILLVICATLIYSIFLLVPSFLSFWVGNTQRVVEVFRWSFKKVIQYPISIYPRYIRIFLTICLPYAWISYYPSLIMLNKVSFQQQIFFLICELLISAMCVLLTLFLWHKGKANYSSAGS